MRKPASAPSRRSRGRGRQQQASERISAATEELASGIAEAAAAAEELRRSMEQIAAGAEEMSGRGVGMDAVRVGAQRLGGRVEVESRPGLGTTIRLSLPQTMMLTPVMMVRAGSDIWGIPLEAVLELQRIDRDRIVTVKDRRAVTWRDRTVPVLTLAEQLAVAPGREAGREADMLVVVVGGEPVGLIVDAVIGRLEALVRPLGGVFSGLPGLTGTTVLGDGRILLVLDLDEVVQ
jgi:two-component system chemotaxis sensor kinase CheA